jgi:hypothetical protein
MSSHPAVLEYVERLSASTTHHHADSLGVAPRGSMLSLQLLGPEHLALLPRPLPTVEDPLDAVVRVQLAGVCGSDLHPFHGREPVDEGTTMVCGCARVCACSWRAVCVCACAILPVGPWAASVA